MPSCCAWGCQNRVEKGFRLFRFPTDEKRRKQWAVRVNRKNWRPSSNSKLCEEHFDYRQFESGRADGRNKLKWTAVPTIFMHRTLGKLRRSPKCRKPAIIIKDVGVGPNILDDHQYCAAPPPSTSEDSQESEVDDSKPCESVTESDTEIKLRKLEHKIKHVRLQLRKVQKEKKTLLKRKVKQEAKISKVFNKDQLLALTRAGTRGAKWSSATVKKAIQLRFACGPTGYQLLLDQQQPLPSIRTLQRRMQTVSFKPGVLRQVFEFMKLKVEAMREEEKSCCLTLDEMSITPNVEYDTSSGKLLGNVTLPGHTGIATHALVCMLGGITSRWKQTVCFHFTGNSTKGETLKPIVLDIIKLSTEVGLHVVAVTSDMGSANRAMWKSFGIICGKHCHTVNKIQHPSNPKRWLYFLADVPHLIKNVKAALVSGHVFTMAPSVVNEYNLTSSQVTISAVKDLATFQEDRELKIAPHLTKEMLTPSHFDKMKVSKALNLMSQAVSAGVRFMVECEGRDTRNLTTAWFLEIMNHWFDLASSRHPVTALSKLHPDKHAEAIKFLKSIIHIFRSMSVGKKGKWKPIQAGVILSTTSIIDIQEDLLDKGHLFLLTSRLTQDCLENLFSSVRSNNPIPSPLAFKRVLKLISFAQFLKTSQTGSYQQDDSEFLIDFLDQPATIRAEPSIANVHVHLSKSISVKDLDNAELNSLYYLAGYCAKSIKKNQKHCDRCISEVIIIEPTASNIGRLTQLKEYKDKCLVHVTNTVFDMLLKVEFMFRGFKESSLLMTNSINKVLLQLAQQETRAVHIRTCHGIKDKLLSKYIGVRLHIFCKRMRAERKKEESSKTGGELGSKSMAMRKLVKKMK